MNRGSGSGSEPGSKSTVQQAGVLIAGMLIWLNRELLRLEIAAERGMLKIQAFFYFNVLLVKASVVPSMRLALRSDSNR